MPDLAVIPLEHLDVLSVRGPDARAFLQGQLSQDIGRARERRAPLAGLHNPQGRCLALLRLFALDDDQILAVLPGICSRRSPRTCAATCCARGCSSRTPPRSGAPMACSGRMRKRPQHAPAHGAGRRRHAPADRGSPRSRRCRKPTACRNSVWHAPGHRGRHSPGVRRDVGPVRRADAEPRPGRAVSFSKGCYTGQEVIARTHYRGQVKRRMQRFHSAHSAGLLPGASVTLEDGRQVLRRECSACRRRRCGIPRDRGRLRRRTPFPDLPRPQDPARCPQGAAAALRARFLKVDPLDLHRRDGAPEKPRAPSAESARRRR